MKKSLLLLLFIAPILSFAKKEFNWNTPIDSETNKITYSGIINSPGIEKETAFRRLQKFVSIMDFGRIENIRCKNKTFINSKFFEDEIRFQDENDGIIIGSGYMPILWRKFNYLWVLFDYKIMASNGQCKYEISNFRTVNFISAPKSKSAGYHGYMFSSGSATFSDNRMITTALEDYLHMKGEKDSYNMYLRENEEVFTSFIKNMIHKLDESVNNSF